MHSRTRLADERTPQGPGAFEIATQRWMGTTRGGLELRWYYVALVTAAIAISYFDRQTISIAVAAIQRTGAI